MPVLPFTIPTGLGDTTVPLTGIPSSESFSGTFNPASTTYLNGIPSDETFGSALLNVPVLLTGIPSTEAMGVARFGRYVPMTAIDSLEEFGALSYEAAFVPTSPITRSQRPLSVAERFSSVTVAQNAVATSETVLSFVDGYNVYQEFRLPRDYTRGKNTSEARTPPLTGFQVLLRVNAGYSDVATLDWVLERYEQGVGWQPLDEGTTIGTARSGARVWYSVYVNEPIDILPTWVDDVFRFGIRGRSDDLGTFMQEVEYENGFVSINAEPIAVRLQPGVPHHFEYDDVPSVLYQDAASNRVYFSTERGAAAVLKTAPNPLSLQNMAAYQSDGTTPLTEETIPTSLNFRILTGTAEAGTDFFGNTFRSVVNRTRVGAVTSLDSEEKDRYWMSKPNPSKFAVESLYFDISDYLGNPSTVDRVMIDPLTPGVFFNIYYTDEGDPGTDNTQWSDKLWHRVQSTYQMKGRYTHVLPKPVTARYIKIEFTHLQPKWYAAGNFQKPILYEKHPKWVLDYFMLRTEVERNTDDPFIARRLGIEYDTLDLAYNYYLDDLGQDPIPNATPVKTRAEITNYLQQRNDTSDQVDGETLAKIRRVFFPYAQRPGVRARLDYLLSTYAIGGSIKTSELVLTPAVPVEVPYTSPGISDYVSNVNREKLIIEQNFPVMYFFLDSRHRYRQVVAPLDNDKAYFAGVKEIAFLRDRYGVAFDAPLYIESAGDKVNTERNDFFQNGTRWETHE